jgi:hypothetical protein
LQSSLPHEQKTHQLAPFFSVSNTMKIISTASKGYVAPSSLQIMPSTKCREWHQDTRPRERRWIQTADHQGITTNGPIPTISIMLIEVACSKFILRGSCDKDNDQ